MNGSMIERAKPHVEHIDFSNKAQSIHRSDSRSSGGYDRLWSVRISAQYRAVGERRGETMSWAWIGTHNEFDKLFA